jgi:hypothetical protein
MTRYLVTAAGMCVLLLVLFVLVDRPAPASGPPPEPFAFPPPGISAIGSVSVPIPRSTRRTQAAISRAVARATNKATPRSVRAATQRARASAAAAGLRLGKIYGVAPETSGSYAWSGETGTFGPGKYCGRVRRFSGFRTTSTGRRARHYRWTRSCRAPREVIVNLSVTFAPIR